jgi:ribulose-phosphate 3-epimerase
MMKAKICPSILSADFAALGAECQKVLDAGADWIHVDVMDGHFVPNLSMGPGVVSSLRKALGTAFLDVHLMVDNPEAYIGPISKAGASQFTFHTEAAADPVKVIEDIHKAGMRAAIAVKPKTPIDAVFPYVDLVDMVLVMTVEPGFGGQKFMHDMMDKVRTLRKLKPDLDIQVDGGLNLETIEEAAAASANCIVAGAIFTSNDAQGMISKFRESVESANVSR